MGQARCDSWAAHARGPVRIRACGHATLAGCTACACCFVLAEEQMLRITVLRNLETGPLMHVACGVPWGQYALAMRK